MSQAVPLEEITALYETLHVTLIIELAASVLFFYDFILTFAREVRCIWRPRLSGAAVLYLLNRYVVLANRIARLIQLKSWRGWTPTHADFICNVAWRWSEVCTILMYLSIAGFAALRMYAVYARDKRVLALVMTLGIINPIVNIYYNTTLSFQAMPPPFTGCGQQSSLGGQGNLIFFLFGSVFTMLFEAIVLGLTWNRTVDHLSVLRKLNIKTTYTALMFRDGTIYFVTLLILTSLSLLSISNSLQGFNNVPALTDTLASICLSRFMLNLRSVVLSGTNSRDSSLHLSQISDLRFARPSVIIGNLGAPLQVNSEEHELLHSPSKETVSQEPMITGYLQDCEIDK